MPTRAGFRRRPPEPGEHPRGAVLERLQDFSALSRTVERRLGEVLSVNATDLAAMEHLITDGALTARELADRLRVSTAASTHVVDRLERAGHITRRPHATDRRKTLVEPVAASVTTATAFLTPLLDGLQNLVDALDDNDRAVVGHFLDAVVDLYAAHTTPTVKD